MTKQMTELLEAAKPLMKYLSENHHPHTEVRVDAMCAQLFEGVCSVKTEEFLRD